MIPSLEIELELSELEAEIAGHYFSRLLSSSITHHTAAKQVLGTVRDFCSTYFREEYLTSLLLALAKSTHEKQEMFFALYGIGGYVAYEGPRGDLDLLMVTNLPLKKKALHDDTEPLIFKLNQSLSRDYELTLRTEVPTPSNLHTTQGRAHISLRNEARGCFVD